MSGNGHVIPGTPIAVDMWNTKNCPQARIFFLSHFHSDHIVGLTSSWVYPIYASPVTCKLIVKKIGVKSSLVKQLEFDEDHLIPLDFEGHEIVTVTLFDANHCPGSAMFLFSGYFGDILYTGDFRYKCDMFKKFQLPTIDILYIDNTYCSPKCIFPTREDSVDKILQQIHICLLTNNRLFLGLDNLGKEDLLRKISKERHCKICVSRARKEVMDVLEMSDIVTTNKLESNIFVVPTNQIRGKNLTEWNTEQKTHAILATARYCGFNFKPYSSFDNIHVIPYSNHSSYGELLQFVQLVRPRAIVPIVGKHTKGIFNIDISDRADMSVFENFLDGSVSSDFLIPNSVRNAMNTWEINSKPTAPTKKRKTITKSKQYKRQISLSTCHSESDEWCDVSITESESSSRNRWVPNNKPHTSAKKKTIIKSKKSKQHVSLAARHSDRDVKILPQSHVYSSTDSESSSGDTWEPTNTPYIPEKKKNVSKSKQSKYHVSLPTRHSDSNDFEILSQPHVFRTESESFSSDTYEPNNKQRTSAKKTFLRKSKQSKYQVPLPVADIVSDKSDISPEEVSSAKGNESSISSCDDDDSHESNSNCVWEIIHLHGKDTREVFLTI